MKAKSLEPMELAEVLAEHPTIRRSLLEKLDQCPLSTRFELEGARYTSPAAARGILFHRFAAEVLQTLRRTGESTIPHEEAIVILREVEAQRDVPDSEVVMCGAEERRMLRTLALKFANEPFDADRIIDVEGGLESTVTYHRGDGSPVERRITGRPDAVLADPPGGAIVIDYKTAWSAPGEGYPPSEDDQATGIDTRISVEGYFQQRFYGLLVMRRYPRIERVTLREFYPMCGEVREATIRREHLEHVEAEVSLLVEVLDRARAGGSESELWMASPGRHCAYCRRPTSCPIEAEARVVAGGITSQAQAQRVAAEIAVVDPIRAAGIKAIKAWHEATGKAIPVRDSKGRWEWRWTKDSGGKRRFKLCQPAKRTEEVKVDG